MGNKPNSGQGDTAGQAGHFAANLKELCGFYPSISEVCRKLGLNRQQFNKYLTGTFMPSLYNLRKICTFFGVEEGEIFLPHDQFRLLVLGRRPASLIPPEISEFLRKQSSLLSDSAKRLQRYVGFYHSYLLSSSPGGNIVRDLTQIYQVGTFTLSKSLVRRPSGGGEKKHIIEKNDGFVFLVNNYIYIVEYQGPFSQTFGSSIIYASGDGSIDLLQGVITSLSHSPRPEIYGSKLVLEYIGARPHIRKSLRDCGVFRPDDAKLNPEIVSLLGRTIVR